MLDVQFIPFGVYYSFLFMSSRMQVFLDVSVPGLNIMHSMTDHEVRESNISNHHGTRSLILCFNSSKYLPRVRELLGCGDLQRPTLGQAELPASCT
jgi:hypothetical protein